MKISYDGKRAFHNFRGLGHFSRTLIKGMIKYYPDNEYSAFTPVLKDERAIRWKNETPELKVIEPENIVSKSLSTLWRSVFLSGLIRKINPDIYHGLSHELPPGISSLRGKSIVTIHDLLFLRFPEFFPYIDRAVYKKKFSYSCSHADKVLAICNQTKKDLIELLGVPQEKIEVVYQSCDPIFYTKLSNDEKKELQKKLQLPDKYILSVGALEPNKNILNLLKAYIKGEFKKTHSLVIVGKGKKYKKILEEVISQHSIQSNVFFYEDVAQEHLPGVYSNADLFVFPSFFEGFGRPIVEALFSGVPVITSKGSCFPEAGGEKTIYVDPHSPLELEAAMKSVLTSSHLREEMIEHGKNYCQKFHLKNTSKNLMEVYRSVVSN